MKTIRLAMFRSVAVLLLLLATGGVLQLLAQFPWGQYFGVRIDSPLNGAQIVADCSTADTDITIYASTSMENTNGAPTVVKVEFYYDTTHLIGTDFTAPYSIVWNNVPVGTYTLTAKAYDSAQRVALSPGVVITVKSPATTLDSNQSGYTFEGGKTYYIKNPITISGTTELQGGAVLKFAPGAKVTVDTLVCPESAANPAILTARDDDSVGCLLPESTHVISGYYGGSDSGTANAALNVIHNGSAMVKNVRIFHAWCGVYFLNPSRDNAAEDAEIAHCDTAIYVDGTGVDGLTVQYLEVSDVNTAFSGNGWAGYAFDIAVSDCYNLAHDDAATNYGFGIDSSTFSDVDNLDVGGTIISLTGDSNGFHNSPQFGTNPYTF